MAENILFTGATGGTGAVILEKLIDQGHTVTAVIRSFGKSKEPLEQQYASAFKKGQLKLLEIPDMAVPGAFDAAAKGASIIMHVATSLSKDNFEEDTIKPAWAFNENVLKAAAASPSVKRVIVTGSIVSTTQVPGSLLSGKTISEKDFNPITYEEALKDAMSAYQYSKVVSEKKSWEWMETHKPHFDLIFLLAPAITGRSIQVGFKPVKGAMGGSAAIFGKLFDRESVKEPLFPIYMDVDDVADIHIKSMSKTEVEGNQRYLFAAAGAMQVDLAANHVREVFPQLRDRVPAGDPNATVPESVIKLDTTRADKTFGTQWKGWKESLTATVQSIVDYEKVHRVSV